MTRKERRIWAQAHIHAQQLRYTRDELRNALSHLGLAFLYRDDTFVFDIRRRAGACWFDRYYAQTVKAQKDP
jgi:hypothetical protein